MPSPAKVSDAWVRRFDSAVGPAEEHQLICFPHAGGSATYYFRLSQMLGSGAQVLGVQYPGRQERRHEPLIDDMGELADRAAEALWPLADRPFAFFGHSMGAIVAFEVARRFVALGAVPERLFASGRRAPSCHRETSFHRGPDAELMAEMRRVGGTDQSLLADPEVRAMILPVVRNDYQAIETYHYALGEPLTCPIIALVGDRDPHTTVAEADAWREHTTGEFDLRVFGGGHFYLDEQRTAVAELIRRTLGTRGEAGQGI